MTPKQKMDTEEINICEKCGEEMSSRMAGDESGKKCGDCGFMDMH